MRSLATAPLVAAFISFAGPTSRAARKAARILFSSAVLLASAGQAVRGQSVFDGFAPPSIASPTPAAQAINLSTRMRVQTGDSVGIGGFIITGNAPKHLLLRAIGPSLAQFGIPGVLGDPVLELHGPAPFATITSNDWRDDPLQEAAILATGIPPTDNLEAAIDVTLVPGAYTAIVRGMNDSSGVGLVEVYDLSHAVPAKLANISTRAFVSTGDDIVIAGFMLGNNNGDDKIVVRGIGPSLIDVGVTNALADPTLQLRDSNGALLISNNDWQDDLVQAAELIAAGLAPTHHLESGIAMTLAPGLYTGLLAGLNNGTGIGLVEVYDRGGGSGIPTPSPTPNPTPGPSPTPTPNPTPSAPPGPSSTPSVPPPGTPTPSVPANTPSPTPVGSPTPRTSPTPTPTPCQGVILTDFDGVIAPALPAGWVATNASGNSTTWVTSTVAPDTAPNAAFLPDQDKISDKSLDSPGIPVTSPFCQVSFRNSYNTEYDPPPNEVFWDGGVMEISSPNINGGAFTDVTDPAVGGVIVAGGYTGTIDGTADNPLAGRPAWSGNSGGYIDTIVNLGPNVNGQTIKLRFRMGTDAAVGAPGWSIDSITFSTCPPPSPTPTPTPSPTPTGTPATPSPTPLPGPCGEITDGGFESGGIPSVFWNHPQTSTNFGTPMCDNAFCGTAGGTAPPRSGLFWVWFGGISAPETATLGQDVTFPIGGPATLHFWMRVGTVNPPFSDVLNVRVDGAIVQSYPEPAVAETDYSERLIDLTAYADGAVHNIEFEYIGPSTAVGSFVVDDVSLIAGGACPTPTPSPTPTLSPTPTPTPGATPCGNIVFIENFDGVTAPALPAGWVATINIGNPTPWVTSTVSPDSPPNDAFLQDQDGVSDKYLDTPSFTVISATAQLSFRNNFNMEFSLGTYWDGGVLEVSSPNINGGAFTDIIDPAVGASFSSGGYTGVIDNTANNPLANRMAWGGDSGGYINTVVNLGPNLNGQTIKLRFRMGTDDAVGAPGWRIDTLSIAVCSGPTPTPSPPPPVTPTPSPSPSATPTPVCPWSPGPNFPAAGVVRAVGVYFSANGRFYSIGGRSSDLAGSDFTNPFEYNPATNAWTIKPSVLPDLLVNNMACGVLTVSGTAQIYCVGGSQATIAGAASRVFSYNPVTDTFTTLTAADNWPGSQGGNFLPGGFAVAGNKLYLIGSFNANSFPPVVTGQVWQFDPNAAVGSRWLARAPLPVARGYVPAATIGGLIYTAGGSNLDPGGALIDSAESFKYDPTTNTWTPIANIPRATAETRAIAMGNQMLVMGGGRVAPNPSNQVNIYDPVSNTWTTSIPFGIARRNFPVDSDGSSRIWLVGGYDSNGTPLNTMEIYGPPACP